MFISDSENRAVFDRECQKAVGSFKSELITDISAVIFKRFNANEEILGNFSPDYFL